MALAVKAGRNADSVPATKTVWGGYHGSFRRSGRPSSGRSRTIPSFHCRPTAADACRIKRLRFAAGRVQHRRHESERTRKAAPARLPLKRRDRPPDLPARAGGLSSAASGRSRAATRPAAARSPGRWSRPPSCSIRTRIPRGLNDSKKLDRRGAREALRPHLRDAPRSRVAFGSPARIDRDNILQASLWALARAVAALPCRPQLVFVDGRDRIDGAVRLPGR